MLFNGDTATTLTPDTLSDAAARIRGTLQPVVPTVDLRPGTPAGDLIVAPAAGMVALTEQAMDAVFGDLDLSNVRQNIINDCDFVQAWLRNLGVVDRPNAQSSGMVRFLFNRAAVDELIKDSHVFVFPAGVLIGIGDSRFHLRLGSADAALVYPAGYPLPSPSSKVFALADIDTYFVDFPVVGAVLSTPPTQGSTCTLDAAIPGLIQAITTTEFCMGNPEQTLAQKAEAALSTFHASSLTTRSGSVGFVLRNFSDMADVSVSLTGDMEMTRGKLNALGFGIGAVDVWPRSKYGRQQDTVYVEMVGINAAGNPVPKDAPLSDVVKWQSPALKFPHPPLWLDKVLVAETNYDTTGDAELAVAADVTAVGPDAPGTVVRSDRERLAFSMQNPENDAVLRIDPRPIDGSQSQTLLDGAFLAAAGASSLAGDVGGMLLLPGQSTAGMTVCGEPCPSDTWGPETPDEPYTGLFFDGKNGSDANDGLTSTTPVKTAAKVHAVFESLVAAGAQRIEFVSCCNNTGDGQLAFSSESDKRFVADVDVRFRLLTPQKLISIYWTTTTGGGWVFEVRNFELNCSILFAFTNGNVANNSTCFSLQTREGRSVVPEADTSIWGTDRPLLRCNGSGQQGKNTTAAHFSGCGFYDFDFCGYTFDNGVVASLGAAVYLRWAVADRNPDGSYSATQWCSVWHKPDCSYVKSWKTSLFNSNPTSGQNTASEESNGGLYEVGASDGSDFPPPRPEPAPPVPIVTSAFVTTLAVTYTYDSATTAIASAVESPDHAPVNASVLVREFFPVQINKLVIRYHRKPGTTVNTVLARSEIVDAVNAISWPYRFSLAPLNDSLLYAGAASVDGIVAKFTVWPISGTSLAGEPVAPMVFEHITDPDFLNVETKDDNTGIAIGARNRGFVLPPDAIVFEEVIS